VGGVVEGAQTPWTFAKVSEEEKKIKKEEAKKKAETKKKAEAKKKEEAKKKKDGTNPVVTPDNAPYDPGIPCDINILWGAGCWDY
jgi:hypothetical protein